MSNQTTAARANEELARAIARQLTLDASHVQAAIALLDEGNTIPFIARYRKEATHGLDEIELRAIEDAVEKARELAARRQTVLRSIEEQGLLTDVLRRQIEDCPDKPTLEAIYLPFKPKRQTRAMLARQRGLQTLADALLTQRPLTVTPDELLRSFVDPARDLPDKDAALQGACDIVAEQWADDITTRQWMIEQAFGYGRVFSRVKRGKKKEADKFETYFDYDEPVKRIPSHRFLAIKRGESEGLLRIGLQCDDEWMLRKLKSRWVTDRSFPFYRELLATAEDAYQRLLLPATESTVLQQLKDRADEEAIAVFAKNLRELLLAPPAGPKVTVGIDPGFRTGCKVAVVDGTGKYLASATIYPTPPRQDTTGAAQTLYELIDRYAVELVAIGNGTASRETDAFVVQVLREHSIAIPKVVVSESGASIYSASELAAREYPDLDLTIRGAISIAHRLQDPLAELVKTDPKSIGVGQYQHDVNQKLLKKCLQREVESCVNRVGVDLNMASATLLASVAGIGPKLAEKIVEYRDEHGRFSNRNELREVPKLGQKAFQQAAGFLRVRGGDQPLDNSAVHPESYYIVEKMAKRLKVPNEQLVGNESLAAKLEAEAFVDEKTGAMTIRDILEELAKPGRDPRQEFRVATFNDAVTEVSDLKPGMMLEGVVTNVTHFGAFVDVGVHQDGLVHVSQLANEFVRDPSEVVAVGDVVRVKVLEVDAARKRISLSRKEVEG
ncbi:MAG: Tex family protein [Pirellulaceae bacterium]